MAETSRTQCIGLANIVTDCVVGHRWCLESTGDGGQNLCGVPSGAAPSLKPVTAASRWPHLAGPAFVVQDFASGEIAPLNQSRTICRFKTLRLDWQLPLTDLPSQV